MKTGKTIGTRIKELRLSRGLAQNDLAKELSVTDAAISKWESNNGLPEINNLAGLAKALDTSIDYLITGKIEKGNSRPISSYEYACLHNDPSVLKDNNLLTKDEFGQTLIAYITKYNSVRIFNFVLRKIKPSFPATRGSLIDSNILRMLFKSNNLKKVYAFGYPDMGSWLTKNYPDGIKQDGRSVFLEEMMTSEKPSSPNLIWLLTAHQRNFVDVYGKEVPFSYQYTTFQTMYPIYVQSAIYAKNKPVAEYALSIIEQINNNAIKRVNESDENSSYPRLCLTTEIKYDSDRLIGYNRNGIRCIKISKPVYQAAIDCGYPDIARRLNDINLKIGVEGFDLREADLIELKNNGKATEEDIVLASYTREGIFEIGRFTKDKHNGYSLIKRALQLPLLRFEKFNRHIEKDEYKKAFEMAVDGGLSVQGDFIKGAAKGTLKSKFETESLKTLTEVEESNLRYIESVCRGEEYVGKKELLKIFRSKMAKAAKIQSDIQETIKEFATPILLNELENGDYRRCAADLISKLEFLLRSKTESYEDENPLGFELRSAIEANFSEQDQEILNKVRLYRNQRIHLLKKSVKINEDELRKAIEIVAKFAKEE